MFSTVVDRVRETMEIPLAIPTILAELYRLGAGAARAPKSLILKNVRQSHSDTTIITCEYPYKIDRKQQAWIAVSIAINEKTQRINWGKTTRWLFDKEHQGSAISAPALISLMLWPLLKPFNEHYRKIEEKRGMWIHGCRIVDLIGDDLDEDVRTLLVNTLQNEYRIEKEEQSVTYEDAIDLLSGCHCDWYQDRSTHIEWFDTEGNRIAWTFTPDSVVVYQTRFVGEKAQVLLHTFDTIEYFDDEKIRARMKETS